MVSNKLMDNYFNNEEYALSQIISLKSLINAKLDNEKKRNLFISEFRQKLYHLHFPHIVKLNYKYPFIQQFHLLLLRYVELEFDILYQNKSRVLKQLEEAVEARVLCLLQLSLLPFIQTEEHHDLNAQFALHHAILELLRKVKPKFLVKNRFIYNIINKLNKKLKELSNKIDIKNSSVSNLVTSDYGTDDCDSDINNDILCKKYKSEKSVSSSEVKDSSLPTVEFIDDDNYCVYLQKHVSRRKTDYKSVNKKKKIPSVNVKIEQELKNKEKANDDLIVTTICLDSDDDDSPNISNKNKTVPGKSRKRKKPAVVTFEIIDDDDDQTNYMVYLQDEVKTNIKKKENERVKKKMKTEEVVISDSEDDLNFNLAPNIDENGKLETENMSNCTLNVENNTASNESELQEPVTENSKGASDESHDTKINEIVINGLDFSQPNHLLIYKQLFNFVDNDNYLVNPSEFFKDNLQKKSMSTSTKSEDFEENDSFLEELLDDNSDLLEDRRFDKLERFLFNDTSDKQGFCFSNFPFDDDSGLQSETLDVAYLDDSDLLKFLS